MIQLSVVIITHDEEKNIERCLNSVREVADDIVVVDSFSTDKTEEICKSYGVNFIQRKWEGYSATKNFANLQGKHDWILSLDADESLSDELQKSIIEWKQLSFPVSARFSRLSNYCGQWIHHCGWYPDAKIRVFDRRKTNWEGEIHEKLTGVNKNKTLHLNGNCFHYSYYSVAEHYKQAEKYSDIAAKDMHAKGKIISYPIIFLKTVFKFHRNYFFKLGFLDGRYGYIICKIIALETYLKYSKLYKLNSK